MNFREFVPPIAVNAIRGWRSGSGRKRYSSFGHALADCTDQGYENSRIVDVVVEKTSRYAASLSRHLQPVQIRTTDAYSLCSLLAAAGTSEVHVLDFGGGAGAHYFLARAMLPASLRLNWLVVETEAMVKRAGASLSNDELGFSSSLDDAGKSLSRIDLVHTSGTLQCVDQPYDYLRKIASLSASCILFNRLGLTRGNHDVVTIHESRLSWNGPGPLPDGMSDGKVRYPFVFPMESAFMQILSEGYRVAATFEDSSGIFAVKDEPIVGLGLLAKRI